MGIAPQRNDRNNNHDEVNLMNKETTMMNDLMRDGSNDLGTVKQDEDEW